MKWASEVAALGFVHMAKFEEGMERITYVVGALELERPFFGLLYRFMTIHPRNSVRKVLPHVSFTLRYLADQVVQSRHCSCTIERLAGSTTARVDAQASGTGTGIGGWYPHVDSDGRRNIR